MAARKNTNLSVVKAAEAKAAEQQEVVETSAAVSDPNLEDRFVQFYNDLVDEIIAVRGAATQADLTLILSAAQAAQGEAEAREFANEARAEGNAKSYISFTKLAESQIRAKSAALGCLGLSGDRRGASQARRAAHAVKNTGAKTKSKPVDGKSRWNDL